MTFTIGSIIGGIETLVGIVTVNPPLIVDGAKRAVTSLVIGNALEPIKDIAGEKISDIIDVVNS